MDWTTVSISVISQYGTGKQFKIHIYKFLSNLTESIPSFLLLYSFSFIPFSHSFLPPYINFFTIQLFINFLNDTFIISFLIVQLLSLSRYLEKKKLLDSARHSLQDSFHDSYSLQDSFTGHGYRTTPKQTGLRHIRPYKPHLLLCVTGHHGSHKGCQFRLVF